MTLKKNCVLVLFMVLTLLGSSSAYAGYTVPRTEIEFLRAYKTYAVVTLVTAGTNPNGCTHSNHSAGAGRYITIEFSTESGREMYAAVLAAYLSGRDVEFGASSGTCFAWGSSTIPNAYRVGVYR